MKDKKDKDWKEDSLFVPLLFMSIAEPKLLPVTVAYWVWTYKVMKWFC